MPLPSTMEEVQSQVLQGDLSENPYLQPSPIISKDKELKTVAKKVIPAINELLKNLNVVNGTIQGFTDEVHETVELLRVELKDYVDKGIEETVQKNSEDISALQELMEEYMKQSLATKVEEMEKTFNERMEEMQTSYDQKLDELTEQIENIQNSGAGGGTGAGGEELNLAFDKEIEILRDQKVVTDYEVHTFNPKQIKVMIFSEAFNQYVLIEPDMTTIKTSGTSVYQCWTYPFAIALNNENKLVFINKSSCKLKVLCYNIV